MTELKPCPFCADHKVWIGVHDDEGNYHGTTGCEYEADHWSGLTYGLHHDGSGDCPMCTDGEWDCMGGMLFDTPEDATEAWNTRAELTCQMKKARWDDGQCTWGVICSACGEKHEHEFEYSFNFCPTCGAKVVEP